MSSHFCISITFLAPFYHGRRDGGDPEWPPSPLRLFQSLVAAGATNSNDREIPARITDSLMWLESLPPPSIIAPVNHESIGYRLSVPNNTMDIAAKAWSRRSSTQSAEANPAKHRTMKTVRPLLLPEPPIIYYLWSVGDALDLAVMERIDALIQTARLITSLGWGVDMAVGDACVVTNDQISTLRGELWMPGSGAAVELRVPNCGTLEALNHRYSQFLRRLGQEGFVPPSPLHEFSTVGYGTAKDLSAQPCAAFSLLKLDISGFRPFDTPNRALTVAGMLRHVVRRAAEVAGKPEQWINTVALGHGETSNASQHKAVGPNRFAYLPLPSIEVRGFGKAPSTGPIRRALITMPAAENRQDLIWLQRALAGQTLLAKDSAEPVAILSLLPNTDRQLRHYTSSAATWATVTPVVLPGYDDPAHLRRKIDDRNCHEKRAPLWTRINNRIDGLLRKAIIHAGYPAELAEHAALDWRHTGFWPGNEIANKYGVPDHLKKFPRLHVKLQWRDRAGQPIMIPGPVCLGSGRFCGLGLFAAFGTQ